MEDLKENACVCVWSTPQWTTLILLHTPSANTSSLRLCYRERERQREMQPAHCFAFTVNNAITARSLVSLRFAFPSCLLPPRLLDFFFFICQEEDGLPVHLLTVSHIFPYEAIFCNDILILTIAREKKEESAIIASLRWLNHGPAEQLAILSLLSLYLFLTQLHSQCRPTYIGGEKHTHIYCLIELNMILLKHNLQYSVRRDAHTFLLRFFFTERSQAARLHSLKSLPSRPPLVGHYFLYNNGNVYEEFGTRSGRRGCRVVWAWAKYINLPLVIFAWIILMLSW